MGLIVKKNCGWKVGRFGRYSWVLPGMVAVFGGVQVLDFIVGDVVGERPITPGGS